MGAGEDAGVFVLAAGVVAACVVDVGAGEAGGDAAGEVETTTVVDLSSVVVQAPEVAAVLGEDAGAGGTAEGAAVAAGVLAEGPGAVGADAGFPPLDDTFEPAGAAGDCGGDACLAAAIVVSRGAAMVVSRRAVADFDALRTLSVGRASEADRAVAKRTCSIIAG